MTATQTPSSVLEERIAKKAHTLHRLDAMIAACADCQERRASLQRLRRETETSMEADKDTLRHLQDE